jgi:two-component system phosphate regulon sensor histidine kinase PhoR
LKRAVPKPLLSASSSESILSAPSAQLFSHSGRIEAEFFHALAAGPAIARLVSRRIKTAHPGAPLRVWVPDCGTGEDAYSVAISLISAFGSRWREFPFCVFATAADADALAHARAGRFGRSAVAGLPSKTAMKFFTADGHGWRAKPFVRESCRFITLSVGGRPPFSRMDLIFCPGGLNSEAESRRKVALPLMHAAMSRGGILIDSSGVAADAPHLFKPLWRGKAFSAADRAALTVERAAGPVVRDVGEFRESEERFRLIFDQAEDAILVRDIESDAIIRANAAATKLYGWTFPELLSMRGAEILAGADVMREKAQERRSAERLRLPQHRRKDGSRFPVDATVSILMLDKRPCHLWMVRDATGRLKADSVRKKEQDRENFLGEVVHELRSPLAVIQGSVETLEGGVRGEKGRRTFLQFIKNQAGRMAALVDQLLDLNSAGGVRPPADAVRIELAEAVAAIAAAFMPVARRRGIVLKVDVPAGLAVIADLGDFPHIVGNLVDNALKYTPRGGAVEIGARVEGKEGILLVRDTGPGIGPEDIVRIFERFYRSDSARPTKGTGLGLAIVRELAQANNGRVYAENGPNGGAIFSVALPLSPEKPSL